MARGSQSQYRRGFTIIEAGVLTLLAGVVATTMTVADPLGSARESAKKAKDAANVRSIHQAFVIWAGSNKDSYPLPSAIDKSNFTVADKGKAKDTSANIMAVLIFNGNIVPETCVSPLENNPTITSHVKYDNASPKAAINPAKACWDPTFNADFTSGKPSHLSYAHQQLTGGRALMWRDTLDASEAILSTRGPEMTGVTVQDQFTAQPTYANASSNTFKFCPQTGTKGWWSGNVVFNDNHVEFIKDHFAPGQPTATGKQYLDKNDKKLPDMAFFDEPDDPKSGNNFLGIFIKAGDTPAAFKAIWD